MSQPRPALIVAAHGSRAAGWEAPVEDFVGHVRQSPGVADVFQTVLTAYLEHSAPSIAASVRSALALGCPRILVAPLFLTVSTHLAEDIPGVLGFAVPDHVRQRLQVEGLDLLPPGLPIELVDLGPRGELLARNAQRRLSLRSETPAEEAIVLCAYGSGLYHEQWEELMLEVSGRLLAAGFAHARHAYVGHSAGLSPTPTLEAIRVAGKAEGVERVFVLPMLLSDQSSLHGRVIEPAVAAARDEGVQVDYAGDAILPDGDLAAHVGMQALGAIGAFVTVDRGVVA